MKDRNMLTVFLVIPAVSSVEMHDYIGGVRHQSGNANTTTTRQNGIILVASSTRVTCQKNNYFA